MKFIGLIIVLCTFLDQFLVDITSIPESQKVHIFKLHIFYVPLIWSNSSNSTSLKVTLK